MNGLGDVRFSLSTNNLFLATANAFGIAVGEKVESLRNQSIIQYTIEANEFLYKSESVTVQPVHEVNVSYSQVAFPSAGQKYVLIEQPLTLNIQFPSSSDSVKHGVASHSKCNFTLLNISLEVGGSLIVASDTDDCTFLGFEAKAPFTAKLFHLWV